MYKFCIQYEYDSTYKDNFNELLSTGQIRGKLFGGKQEMSAVFLPEFYHKAQKKYVDSFFKQNGYIG